MSKFSAFMKQNKIKKENEFYAPTESLVDKDKEPLKWEFRHITSKENERIREACTKEVQVKGKPNLFRPKINSEQYTAKLIVASVVYPDLYDVELQDSYDVKTPEDLLYALVDDVGEYQGLTTWIQNFQGFTKSFEEKVDEAKN